MNEYLFLGHMEEVSVPLSHHYTIPYRAVIRESNSTNKVRVVFNASCRVGKGSSLNDILIKGPQIKPDIFDVLIRFREHPFVFKADIEKMYRQVLIENYYQNLQCIY